ncbi:hypothetical protein LTR56_006170 [Elasticomyces elasticus]|nr:hypothetical protein LTR22_012998 [Elasticomyces elasticus]KAK3650465.1 hypothetical protein LTR56_006170 [Elasticomyces elasticus]KAK4928197.1 hypothetical protein LTR49_005135 [Elasticomyces elasticus]KAK5765951.1 hypothetical protein LTS12_003958 [Elasticomyces elasticus]
MEIQGLVPTITYPNTKSEAINVDEYEPSSLPVPPSQTTRTVADVAFASARYTGNGAKRIKIEDKMSVEHALAMADSVSDDTDISDDEVEPQAHVKREIIEIDSEDETDHGSSDDDDNDEHMAPSFTNRGSTFGDEAAYGRTPQPRLSHREPSVFTPRSYDSRTNDQANNHRTAPSQSGWSPAPEDNLVSLFKSPPEAAPAQPVLPVSANPAEGTTSSLAPSSNQTGREEVLARLQYLRNQQEIADIEAQLSKS